MTQNEIDNLTPKELAQLEAESDRAWLDKRQEKQREAMQVQREYLGRGFDYSREDIEEARDGR